jgi:hypothetical protein
LVLFQLFTAGINTGGKFATNIVDTGGTLRIFEKIRNEPNVIFWGFGEDDS